MLAKNYIIPGLIAVIMMVIAALLTSLTIAREWENGTMEQLKAMMPTFFFYFPAVLLSGFMFPIANMPDVVQLFTYLNPLRYFLVIIRGIFLKGMGVAVLWPQILALLVLGSLVLTLAVKRFRKTIA